MLIISLLYFHSFLYRSYSWNLELQTDWVQLYRSYSSFNFKLGDWSIFHRDSSRQIGLERKTNFSVQPLKSMRIKIWVWNWLVGACWIYTSCNKRCFEHFSFTNLGEDLRKLQFSRSPDFCIHTLFSYERLNLNNSLFSGKFSRNWIKFATCRHNFIRLIIISIRLLF